MTKGENRAKERRRIRRVLKNPRVDVRSKTNHRKLARSWNAVTRKSFPKQED